MIYHADKQSYINEVEKMYNEREIHARATIYALTWATIVIEFIACLATA